MDQKISDEQIERILQRLVSDTALDENTVDEIAAAPQMWWNVQSRIKNEESRRANNGFFVWRRRIAAFACAALVFFAAFILFSNLREDRFVARQDLTETAIAEKPATAERETKTEQESKPEQTASPPPKTMPEAALPQKQTRSELSAKPRKINVRQRQIRKNTPKSNTPEIEKEEIKTDFITLAYSPAAESGQILRVKVPRSMMVSLGVAANVEKTSELVQAEVVVGDDGITRAIRFIQ